MMGEGLDWVTLWVFSNLGDSMILRPKRSGDKKRGLMPDSDGIAIMRTRGIVGVCVFELKLFLEN